MQDPPKKSRQGAEMATGKEKTLSMMIPVLPCCRTHTVIATVHHQTPQHVPHTYASALATLLYWDVESLHHVCSSCPNTTNVTNHRPRTVHHHGQFRCTALMETHGTAVVDTGSTPATPDKLPGTVTKRRFAVCASLPNLTLGR